MSESKTLSEREIFTLTNLARTLDVCASDFHPVKYETIPSPIKAEAIRLQLTSFIFRQDESKQLLKELTKDEQQEFHDLEEEGSSDGIKLLEKATNLLLGQMKQVMPLVKLIETRKSENKSFEDKLGWWNVPLFENHKITSLLVTRRNRFSGGFISTVKFEYQIDSKDITWGHLTDAIMRMRVNKTDDGEHFNTFDKIKLDGGKLSLNCRFE